MEDLKEIYEKTIQEGKPFILTEEMLNAGIKNIDKPIKSIEDLVMVHVTNFFPSGAIKTPYETELMDYTPYECVIDGEEKNFVFQIEFIEILLIFALMVKLNRMLMVHGMV